MSSTPIKLAVIVGSTREGRFAPVVANWFTGQARQRDDMSVDVIDLAENPLPVVLPAFGGSLAPEDGEALAAVTVRLADADAFAVVTPEYNHSFPASLKNLIDWHNRQWHAKPVGFVSYGGLAGGLRAVEHLRQVFAELHAVTVRDTVSFHGMWESFGEDGRPKDPNGPAMAAKTLLDQLTWWARVLRDAKAITPYNA